jgi:hypothetical protein
LIYFKYSGLGRTNAQLESPVLIRVFAVWGLDSLFERIVLPDGPTARGAVTS